MKNTFCYFPHLSPVSLTPVVHMKLRISARISEIIRNSALRITRNTRKMIHEKTEVKHSRHCPIKYVLYKISPGFLHMFCMVFSWLTTVCSLSREHIAVTLICWYNICISGPLQLYLYSNIIYISVPIMIVIQTNAMCIVHRWVFIHVNVCLLSFLWCFSQIFLLLKGSRSCLEVCVFACAFPVREIAAVLIYPLPLSA